MESLIDALKDHSIERNQLLSTLFEYVNCQKHQLTIPESLSRRIEQFPGTINLISFCLPNSDQLYYLVESEVELAQNNKQVPFYQMNYALALLENVGQIDLGTRLVTFNDGSPSHSF